MGNEKTKYNEQEIFNYAVDDTVKPPLLTVGMRTWNGTTWVKSGDGIGLPGYDYVSMALSAGDTTETYTFKTGGSGGVTVSTVVVVYTDSTRDTLSSVTRT